MLETRLTNYGEFLTDEVREIVKKAANNEWISYDLIRGIEIYGKIEFNTIKSINNSISRKMTIIEYFNDIYNVEINPVCDELNNIIRLRWNSRCK